MKLTALWGALGCYATGLLSASLLTPAQRALIALAITLTVALTLLLMKRSRRPSTAAPIRGVLRAGLISLLLGGAGLVRAPAYWSPAPAGESVEEGVRSGLRNPGYSALLPRLAPPTGDGRPRGTEAPAAVRPGRWASPAIRGLVQGILLNRRSAVPPAWREAFRMSGTSHLLAVSGLHVGILIAVLLGFFSLLPMDRRHRSGCVLAIIWAWILFIGAPPSAVRAGGMATVLLMAWQRGSRTDRGRILPGALLVLLFMRPSLLASTGFQLSAGAVVGIGLSLRHAQGTSRLRGAMAVALGAQAGVLPVQILVFSTINPLALLANLVLVPLTAIWVPIVLLAEAADLLGGLASAATASLAEGVGRSLVWGATGAAALPGAQTWVPAWAGWVALAALLGWAAGRRGIIPALLALMVVVWSPLMDAGTPRVVFLDVGQGDATVLEVGRPRRTVVIDAGPSWPGWDAGTNVILPYLRTRGIERVDVMLVSHPDGDHLGGAEALLDAIPVGMLLGGRWLVDTDRGRRLAAHARQRGVLVDQVFRGDRVGEGGWQMEVLAGAESETGWSESNDRSVVVLARLPTFSMLAVGDIEQSGESRLRASSARLRADVLKVAHHGSGDASGEWLLENVRPRLAVISAGRGNRYGHPAPETLVRLHQHGAATWRTDLYGALVLEGLRGLERSVERPILGAYSTPRHYPDRDRQHDER